MIKGIAIFLILILAGCGPTLKPVVLHPGAVEAERERQLEIAFSTLMQRHDRLNNVSYPLLVSASEMCKDVKPFYGFTLHDRRLYGKVLGKEYEAVAVRYFKLGNEVAIRYVHPRLPAGLVGLRIGDRLLKINNISIEGKDAIQAMRILHGITSEKEPLHLLIERDALKRELTIHPVSACNYAIHLVNDDAVNAFADGSRVAITTGMMRFVNKDEELALVIGHEIAHNALGHIDKKLGHILFGTLFDILAATTLGVDTQGVFGRLGAHVFSKEFEAEADYAGLYIVARAGYDITDAANFWRRMAMEYPAGVRKGDYFATHPSFPERFVLIEGTVREIEEKRKEGKPLLPERKKE